MEPQHIEGLFTFFLGLYFTLLGYKKIGQTPGKNLKFDNFMNSHGRVFKLSPVVMIFGILQFFNVFKG